MGKDAYKFCNMMVFEEPNVKVFIFIKEICSCKLKWIDWKIVKIMK